MSALTILDKYRLEQQVSGFASSFGNMVLVTANGVINWMPPQDPGKIKTKSFLSGVTVDQAGSITITCNTMKINNCRKMTCSARSKTACVAFTVDYRGAESEHMYLTSPCSVGHKQSDETDLPEDELSRMFICDVTTTNNFHTVVCDKGNVCLYVFKAKKYLRKVTLGGILKKGNVFKSVCAICSTLDNLLVVSDYIDNCLKVLDVKGKFHHRIGPGVPGGFTPYGICMDAWDRIVVADRDHHRILLFDVKGKLHSNLINTMDKRDKDLDLRPHFVGTFKGSGGNDKLAVYAEGPAGKGVYKVWLCEGLSSVSGTQQPEHQELPPAYSETTQGDEAPHSSSLCVII